MWNQSQPFCLLIEVAPTAHITSVGEEEIDWAIELVRPLPTVRDGASLRVDEQEASGSNHWIKGIVLTENAIAIMAG